MPSPSPTKSGLLVSVDRLVGELGVQLFTVSQVAEMIGRSGDTITRWRREGKVTPSYEYLASDESYRVYLYSKEDLKAAKEMAKAMDKKMAPKAKKGKR